MKLIIAHPYTDKAGRAYKPGEAANLPEGEARRVVERGYGRLAEADNKVAPAAKIEGK